jgi:hypothetical protein
LKPNTHQDPIDRVTSANKPQGKALIKLKRKPIKLKKKAVEATAAALGMALLFSIQGARAAAPASDNGSTYVNPWGPGNPQNKPATGFAPWVFDQFNPPTTPFFVDTAGGAWGINVPPDVTGTAGYVAAWASFTGDGSMYPGQTFTTTVLYTPPGPRTATDTPTEGIDFFAQDPVVASHYDSFGHQVLGIYLGPNSSGVNKFVLTVHTTLSDEAPKVAMDLALPFTGTVNSPQAVTISFTQLAQGNWVLTMVSGATTVTATSQQLGATWNVALGLDAVRYFTSQGGATPGGPLKWQNMSLSAVPSGTNPDPKVFNGAGNDDVVLENNATGQRVIWVLNNGVYSSALSLPSVSPNWHIAGVGDFLGDGLSDVVLENTVTGQHAIWICNNGTIINTIALPVVPNPWHIVGAGDFNGDTNADLVWENTTTGERSIWLLKNGVFSLAISLPTVPPSWHIAGVGDFLNNGQSDLVLENTSTGQHAIWILKNGIFQSSIALSVVGAPWHIAGAGKFTSSGFADLVWQNTATGQRAIWLMNNGVFTSAINLPTVSPSWSIVDH